VTSFFGIKGALFAFFSKTTKWICAKFFHGLGENTCSIQPTLKSTASDLQAIIILYAAKNTIGFFLRRTLTCKVILSPEKFTVLPIHCVEFSNKLLTQFPKSFRAIVSKAMCPVAATKNVQTFKSYRLLKI